MSFSSPQIIQKILNIFEIETVVLYVAILDYDENIKARMIRNENENTSFLETRSIDGLRAIKGMYSANQQFFDETHLIMITNKNNTEFFCLSNFLIYVATQPKVNENKITTIREKIRKLENELIHIVGFEINKSENGS